MEILPTDCWTVIFSFVAPTEVEQLLTVCKEWNTLVNTAIEAVPSDAQPSFEITPEADPIFAAKFVTEGITATDLKVRGEVICTAFKYNSGALVIVRRGHMPMPIILDGDRMIPLYIRRFSGMVGLFKCSLARLGTTTRLFQAAIWAL